MARIGIAGYLNNKVKFLDARPTLIWIMDQIENFANGQVDSTNLADGAVTTSKLTDLSVTASKIALATITSAQTADGVGLASSLTFTGDGVTANRVITLPFTPRWVQIIPTTGTFTEYVAHGVDASSYNWARDNTGAIVSNAANFQGIVALGVKLGTNAAGTANVAGVVYSVVAWR